MINAFTMGIEVEQSLKGGEVYNFETFEFIFTAIYILELACRLYAFGSIEVSCKSCTINFRVPAALTNTWVHSADVMTPGGWVVWSVSANLSRPDLGWIDADQSEEWITSQYSSRPN